MQYNDEFEFKWINNNIWVNKNNIRYIRVQREDTVFYHPESSYDDIDIILKKIPKGFRQALYKMLPQLCHDLHIFSDLIRFGFEVSYEQNENENKATGKKKKSKIFNQVPEFVHKRVIVFGEAQSGKTNCMVALSILYNLLGLSSLILLRDVSLDKDLLVASIKRESKILSKKLVDIGYTAHVQDFIVSVIDETTDEALLEQMLTAKIGDKKQPIIYVCIAHEKILEKLATIASRVQTNFVLFIDEVDLVDSGTEMRGPFIQILKDSAKCTFGVTATALPVIADWNIPSMAFKTLTPGPYYKSANNIKLEIVDVGKNSVPNKDDFDVIVKEVPYLILYLDRFNKQEYHKKVNLDNDPHPMFGLINITHYVLPQKAIVKHIRMTYPNTAVLFFNDDGSIKLFHKLLTSRIVLDEGCKSGFSTDTIGPVHSFKNVEIGQVINYLQNQGVEKFHHILCVAGRKAGRSVRFSSSRRGFRWHVSEMLGKLSYTITGSEAIQTIQRLSGNFEDNLIPTYYGSAIDWEAFQRGYKYQKECFANTLFRDRTIKEMKPVLEELPISKWKNCKLTKGGKESASLRPFASKETFKPNYVEDDGRLTREDYEFDAYKEAKKKVLEELKKKNKEEKIDGVVLSKLRKWFNDDKSWVSKMISFLNQQTKPISFKDFRDGIAYNGSDKQFGDNIDGGRSINAKYGMLWTSRNKNNVIQINPNIKKYINSL